MESSSCQTNQPLIPISSLIHNPSSPMDPIAHVEKQVKAVFDDLVAMGALQETNQMDIKSLLNPVGESHILTEASDVEIYQAVINAVDAHKNMVGMMSTTTFPLSLVQTNMMSSRQFQLSIDILMTRMTPFHAR